MISVTLCQMRPKQKKPSKSQTTGGKLSTQCPSFLVSSFPNVTVVILFYTMCRVKGKNNPSVETKFEARSSRAEEAQDRAQRILPAVHRNARGTEEGRN